MGQLNFAYQAFYICNLLTEKKGKRKKKEKN